MWHRDSFHICTRISLPLQEKASSSSSALVKRWVRIHYPWARGTLRETLSKFNFAFPCLSVVASGFRMYSSCPCFCLWWVICTLISCPCPLLRFPQASYSIFLMPGTCLLICTCQCPCHSGVNGNPSCHAALACIIFIRQFQHVKFLFTYLFTYWSLFLSK